MRRLRDTLDLMGYRWLLPVWLVVSLVAVYSRHGQFLGSWLWTGDWVAGSLVLTGPLAAGIAATAASQQRAVFGEATSFAQRGVRWSLVGFGRCAGVLLMLQLLVLLQAYVATFAINPHVDLVAVWWELPQFVVLLGYVGFGWAVGSFIDTALSGGLVAIVCYVVSIFPGPLPGALFDYGGATDSLFGLQPDHWLQLGRMIVAVALAALALTLVSARRGNRRSLVSGAAALALGALGLSFLANPASAGFVARQEPYVCQDSGVRICVPRSASYAASDLGSVFSELGDRMQAVGAPLPDVTMVAFRADGSPPPDVATGSGPVRYFPLVTPREGSVAAREAPYLVLDVEHCSPKSNQEARSIASIRTAALQIARDVDPAAEGSDNGGSIGGLSDSQRDQWLGEVFRAAAACRLGDVPRVP